MKKFICLILISAAAAFMAKYSSIISSFAYPPAPIQSKVISDSYSPDENSVLSNSSFSVSAAETITENYNIPSSISSKEQWKQTLKYCTDNLYDSITLVIKNFDENTYNMKDLNLINASIKASGSVKSNKTAEITYTFIYKENYILNKAAKDNKYISKLTDDGITLFNKIKKLTGNIVNNNMSDFEKEKAIHDYIVLNSSYLKSTTNDSYSIRNLIENGSGVCEAYAYTFRLMCTFAGLECEIITGTLDGENHGWNLIKLDGEYYHVDVTSDDPVPNKEGQTLYFFFNLNDEEMSKTHIWDKSAFPKATGTKYNYYVYNNSVVTSFDELKSFILKNIDLRKPEIHFYVKNFIIKGTEDFKFCERANTRLTKFYLTGNIGSGGAFMFLPTYA